MIIAILILLIFFALGFGSGIISNKAENENHKTQYAIGYAASVFAICFTLWLGV
ncbi:hypothetical protein [Evansella tamaricis]|uniref:NADH dehydrogenase subunit 5 n=1 Tax=Evansella tamaricis TaxID=2069301 RepID=A0ABS6JLM7_9BACI|nr:hypothetical protein [Evansella tamaricis]MBU9714438.1 hypothetical protein [Evansella tamaricis]